MVIENVTSIILVIEQFFESFALRNYISILLIIHDILQFVIWEQLNRMTLFAETLKGILFVSSKLEYEKVTMEC
jgi:hypothetical protein